MTKITKEITWHPLTKPPPADDHEYYGKRYSVPVFIADINTGEVYDRLMMWDFHCQGWVEHRLPEGADADFYYQPDDMTHWTGIPEIT